MISIAQTFDYDFVCAVTKHKKIWPWVSDDNTDFESYYPSDIAAYLLIEEDGERVGYFAIRCVNSVCYEGHIAILPEAWGRSIHYMQEGIAWIFSNTECKKLIVMIPEKNKAVLSLAIKSGLEQEGVIRKSFLQSGVLHDQLLLGISKGDVCHQQF
jgi:RimJ/RimL family protein N-acetyltransferase